MRIILIWFIKVYWFLIPVHKRNKCIFKESCSRYVFRISSKQGFIKGLKAFYYRYQHCRPGYYIINGPEGQIFISAQNRMFEVNDVNIKVLGNSKVELLKSILDTLKTKGK